MMLAEGFVSDSWTFLLCWRRHQLLYTIPTHITLLLLLLLLVVCSGGAE